MKKTILVVATILVSNLSLPAQVNSKSIADAMIVLMSNMKDYTLAIANQMPEEKFEYKPSESAEVRTFAEHFKHMKNFMTFQLLLMNNSEFNIQEVIKENKVYEEKSLTKDQVILDLSNKFDEVIEFYKNTKDRELKEGFRFYWEPNQPTRSRLLMTMALRDHVTHHRAQALIYLRENGIAPVQYQAF